MFYNGIDYYYFNGVLAKFKSMLHDLSFTKTDLIEVLNKLNFPFKHITVTRDGEKKIIGIYKKSIINGLFSSKDKTDNIRKMFNDINNRETEHLHQSLQSYSNTHKENQSDKQMVIDFDAAEEEYEKNKEFMLNYINGNVSDDPDEPDDMEKASRELLLNDEIFYE